MFLLMALYHDWRDFLAIVCPCCPRLGLKGLKLGSLDILIRLFSVYSEEQMCSGD